MGLQYQPDFTPSPPAAPMPTRTVNFRAPLEIPRNSLLDFGTPSPLVESGMSILWRRYEGSGENGDKWTMRFVTQRSSIQLWINYDQAHRENVFDEDLINDIREAVTELSILAQISEEQFSIVLSSNSLSQTTAFAEALCVNVDFAHEFEATVLLTRTD